MSESIEEQIRLLEEELKKTPYNKATQHHIGLVKAKLARLRDVLEKRSTKGKKGVGYAIKKSGDATVVIVGFPSVGKSTLLNELTGAQSKVAPYAFTTLNVIPGTLKYQGANIQILDVPGLIRGAASGSGKGKEVISVIRSADLIVILLDATDAKNQIEIIKKELYEAGIRLNEKKPDVKITKRLKGGIDVNFLSPTTNIDKKTIEGILKEFRIMNAEVIVKEDITIDKFIDVIESNKVYIPSIVVLNKVDLIDEETLKHLVNELNCIPISAEKRLNLERLKEEIFEKLNLIKIYLKRIGKKADVNEPLIMKKGCTIRDVCEKIHKDFVRRFRFAKVWGRSAMYPGQQFGIDHVLENGDIVQIHLR